MHHLQPIFWLDDAFNIEVGRRGTRLIGGLSPSPPAIQLHESAFNYC